MGKNVPHNREGAVGDITVREIPVVGLRAYIKTESGWYDINAMVAGNIIEWRDINYTVSGTGDVSCWISHLFSESQKAQYCRDSHGLVHFRGCIQNLKIADTAPASTGAWEASQSHTNVSQDESSGDGTGILCNIETDSASPPGLTFSLVNIGEGYDHGDTVTFQDPGESDYYATITLNNGSTAEKNSAITTLPVGFRPYSTVIVPCANVTATAIIKITSAGVVSGLAQTADPQAQFLDGISFSTKQITDSVAQGGTRSGGGSSTGRGTTT